MRRSNYNEKPSFSEKKVSEMGTFIEDILRKKKITEKERNILKYMMIFLNFRRSVIEMHHKKNNKKNSLDITENPHTETLEEVAEKIDIEEEKFIALNLWIRGARKEFKEHLSEREMKELYKRADEKVKSSP